MRINGARNRRRRVHRDGRPVLGRESEQQIMETAEAVAEAGAKILRGGAFKPRTSPYDFQGMELEGLKLLHKAKDATGLADHHRSDERPRRGYWWPNMPTSCRSARATCRISRC